MQIVAYLRTVFLTTVDDIVTFYTREMVRTALLSRVKRRSLPQLLVAVTAVDAVAAAAAPTDSATVFIIRLRQLRVFHVAKCVSSPACKRRRAESMLDLCSRTCIYRVGQ